MERTNTGNFYTPEDVMRLANTGAFGNEWSGMVYQLAKGYKELQLTNSNLTKYIEDLKSQIEDLKKSKPVKTQPRTSTKGRNKKS